MTKQDSSDVRPEDETANSKAGAAGEAPAEPEYEVVEDDFLSDEELAAAVDEADASIADADADVAVEEPDVKESAKPEKPGAEKTEKKKKLEVVPEPEKVHTPEVMPESAPVTDKDLKDAVALEKRINTARVKTMEQYIKIGSDLAKVLQEYEEDVEYAAAKFQESTWEYWCKKMNFHYRTAERIITNTQWVNACGGIGIKMEEFFLLTDKEKITELRKHFDNKADDPETIRETMKIAQVLNLTELKKSLKDERENNTSMKPPAATLKYKDAWNAFIEYWNKITEEYEITEEATKEFHKEVTKKLTQIEQDNTY